MHSRQHSVTVIVPAYNAEHFLPSCLDAIRTSTLTPHEILVVNDRSTDGTAEVARSMGAEVLETDSQSGPGAARNLAAKRATGEILLFLDADVVVHSDTVELAASNFEGDPDIVAVFGSYDDDPPEKNFVSQYKNLYHHYVHQRAGSEASTFWAGCGAIRRDVFLEVGGFDLKKYPVPSIEDIELGHRLKLRGYRIVTDKRVNVQHLKKWTLWSMVKTDIFCRAIPWCRLILESKQMPQDLNLKLSDRISAGLVGLVILLIPLAFFSRAAAILLVPVAVGFLAANRDLYGFFLKQRGVLFLIRAILLHAFYYLYSAVTFGFCWMRHKLAIFRESYDKGVSPP